MCEHLVVVETSGASTGVTAKMLTGGRDRDTTFALDPVDVSTTIAAAPISFGAWCAASARISAASFVRAAGDVPVDSSQ